MDIPCICPLVEGQLRHAEGDRVEFHEKLDFRSSLMVQNTILELKEEDPGASGGDVMAVLTEGYVLAGIKSWTVVGVDGKPIEPTKPAIRELLLTRLDVALSVAEEADRLYRVAVLAPLVAKASPSSPPTPTDESTSPISTSPEQNQNHSSPSSISTTPMDDTETTSLSLVGGSSSSQN
jgi:hypothetical protein